MTLEKEERVAIKMMAGYYSLDVPQRSLCAATSALMAWYREQYGLDHDAAAEAVDVASKAQELAGERESLLGRWEEAYV